MQQFLSALLLLANPAAGDQPQAAPPPAEAPAEAPPEAPKPETPAEPEAEAPAEAVPPAQTEEEKATEESAEEGQTKAAESKSDAEQPASKQEKAEAATEATPSTEPEKALAKKVLLTIPIRMETGENGMSELSSFLLGYLQRPAAEGETLSHIFAEFLTAAAAKQPSVEAADSAKVKALTGETLETYTNCCSGRGPMTTVADATGATLVAHGAFLRREEGFVLVVALWDTTEAGDPKTRELRAADLVSFQDQLPGFVSALFAPSEAAPVAQEGAETVLVVLAPEVSPEPVKLVQQAFDGAVSAADGYRVAREKLVTTLVPDLQVAVNQGCRLPSCRQRMLTALKAEVGMILELNSTGSNMVLTAFRVDGSVIGRVQGSCPGCLDKGGVTGLNPVVQKLVNDVFTVKQAKAASQVVDKPSSKNKKGLLDPRGKASGVKVTKDRPKVWKPSTLAIAGVTAAAVTGLSAGVMTAMTRQDYLAAAERGAGAGEIGALADQGRARQLTANLGYVLAVAGGIASFVMEREPVPVKRKKGQLRRIGP